MKDVFVVSHNIISPLGRTSAENFSRLKAGDSGIALQDYRGLSDTPVYAALFDKRFEDELAIRDSKITEMTKFERLLTASVGEALAGSSVDPTDPGTILIVSTTKGNIDLLGSEIPKERLSLYGSARRVADHFQMIHQPLVVSNACISGLLGVITGMRLIRSGRYKNVIVAGADLISKFVLSGFQSFQAVSPEPCRPFDKDRTGISLGEAAATMILSADGSDATITVAGGATGNDANHISGPSRTGAELCMIIQKVLQEAAVSPEQIDLISAHGTATPYNDEMEAKAIALAGLESVPVNSLKGYYGHTLGAAGLVESIITLLSMEEDLIIPTLGFRELGVSRPIHIAEALTAAKLDHCLKTASGFGGCNAAVLFCKINENIH